MTPNEGDDDRTVFDPDRTVFDAGSAGDAAPRPRPGGTAIKVGDVLNHMFAVTGFLARGGMGEVFVGANIITDERVAIKVMLPALAADPNVITLFRREAQTLTRLHHEAVVQYRVLAQEPELGVLYIVTEYIDGASLSDVLSSLKPSAQELGALLRRLASGLAAAHALGAIHRDVSPDNVLMPGGRLTAAKLIDFGIAKDLDPGTATVIGDGFAGKLGYVAPEQLGDFGRAMGPWTDVYSLGLVIAAVARGSDLGLGGTLVDAVDKRRAGIDLSAVPQPLRSVVAGMVRPDPADRFQTMGAVLAALDAAEVPGASGGRWPRWWPAVLVGGLVLAILLGWLILRGKPSATPSSTPVAVTSDPVARARDAIDAALPSVSCTWLRIVAVTQSAAGPRVALTGVAGNPTQAQSEIVRTLQAQGLTASAIDFADVSPITQSGCAALDAYRQIRATGRNRLSVPQRRFEMRTQPPGSAYAGKLAANAIIGITIGNPSLDFALVGLEPSGAIDMLIPNRAAFEEQMRASRNGVPITDLGGDRYRLQLDLDHQGWSGLLLITGKGPFDASVIAPPLGARDAAWRTTFVERAAERGWQADMIWFRSVDDAKD
ncbi:kinase domain protein [Sphingomonas sp. S17]|uniref:Serine/threonine protein kinase n=2 Tax=Sphingomonas paucimobilis TaxID=13689 RepID=A0A7T3A9I3_SPHPI|nr:MULTISPECIES: serine/threonine-protein kinase [Sphingomonas]EGI55306.1 kinase domain protein [Sphingomonas sp. S17]MCM3680648.1 serine/threonine protein kinase [Sphingomonas paucimobilis]MDG5971331.1 serine/threonine protein kinase [Sphingomonas paucimobilis]QPS15905.1 serine/threonine protein kinase [Sphingomonas paucimobilis]QPT07359.1 serine/threonine protein kinase [Sphingomonas paucimobilis]